ncbi:unnamed protein product, partial [Sphacelaria rigidula]
ACGKCCFPFYILGYDNYGGYNFKPARRQQRILSAVMMPRPLMDEKKLDQTRLISTVGLLYKSEGTGLNVAAPTRATGRRTATACAHFCREVRSTSRKSGFFQGPLQIHLPR